MAETKEEGRRPFAAVLQDMRQGDLHSELSDALADVVAAALEHRKPGQVTLTLTIKPNPDETTVYVQDKIAAKVPEADRPPSLFFTSERGDLTRKDPRQEELPLREVNQETGEVTDLKEATNE